MAGTRMSIPGWPVWLPYGNIAGKSSSAVGIFYVGRASRIVLWSLGCDEDRNQEAGLAQEYARQGWLSCSAVPTGISFPLSFELRKLWRSCLHKREPNLTKSIAERLTDESPCWSF